MDKDSTIPGDSITFFNCSVYDGYPGTGAGWIFGDGTAMRASEGQDPMKHAYSKSGIYRVEMRIGGAHNGESVADTIIVK